MYNTVTVFSNIQANLPTTFAVTNPSSLSPHPSLAVLTWMIAVPVLVPAMVMTGEGVTGVEGEGEGEGVPPGTPLA